MNTKTLTVSAWVLVVALLMLVPQPTLSAHPASRQGVTAGPCQGINGPVCVGSDSSCNYTNVQDAIDAVATGSSNDTTIHIAKNQNYTSQHLVVHNRSLTLRGGYSSCSDYIPSGNTVLDGSNGSTSVGSVVAISADGGYPVIVELRNLTLSHGGPPPLGAIKGGGVSVSGDVELDLFSTIISNNRASVGGGIYVDGTPDTVVLLGTGSAILNNTATALGSDGLGGGIYCENDARLDIFQGLISGNVAQADGTPGSMGGGMYLDGCSALVATIGSNAGIRLNIADFGGGIYAFHGKVNFEGNDTGSVPLIANVAGYDGGGMYLFESLAQLDGANVEGNLAGFSSASGSGGAFVLDSSYLAMDSASCTACSTLKNNDAGVSGSGSAVAGYTNGSDFIQATIQNTVISGNGSANSGFVLSMAGPTHANGLILNNNLITDNKGTSLASIIGSSSGLVRVVSSTIAGNDFSGVVFYNSGTTPPMNLSNSIVYETPNKNTVATNSGVTTKCVMTNSGSGLASAPTVSVDDPKFIDAANGNYHLQADSPAIDFCTYVQYVQGNDLDGNARGQDAPQVPDRSAGALFDLGAYEWADDAIFTNGFEEN